MRIAAGRSRAARSAAVMTSLVVAALTTGCSYVRFMMEQAAAPRHRLTVPSMETKFVAAPSRTSAGAAEVDITPPPGFPTGGDGMGGRVARGYWTRLYARAFFFEAGDRRLLLVSSDLHIIPEALHIEVSSRLADLGLRRDEVILAATHTHQGPGNYSSTAIFNEFASAHMGFSRPLFDFLAGGITEAARQAIQRARSANEEVRLVRRAGRGPDVFLNRSPEAFLLNADRDELMRTWNPEVPANPEACGSVRCDGEPEKAWRVEGCPRLRAVDRTIQVLEVWSGERPIAELLFLAIHPTVLRPDAPLYSADIAGALAKTRERRYARRGENVVVGFFNGAEGDVVARRTKRDLKDVVQIADRISEAVDGLPETTRGTLSISVSFESASAADRCDDIRLARKPAFGVAALGGGEGDRTYLYSLGWHEGLLGPGRDGQGPKLPGLDSTIVRELRVTELLAPAWKFTGTLPMTYARLGPMELVTVPVEMSTTSGWNVRRKLEPADPDAVTLIGLANGYAAYVATADEYLAQEYEGASTMWGGSEARYLACRALHLKQDEPRPSRVEWRRTFKPGAPPLDPFGPAFLGELELEPLTGCFPLLRDSTERPPRDLPSVAWTEDVSRLKRSLHDAADYRITTLRTVRILEKTAAGEWIARDAEPGVPGDVGIDDDAGLNLLTIMNGADGDARRWSAVWTRPLRAGIGGTFRFEIDVQGAQPCRSVEFHVPGPVGMLETVPKNCILTALPN